MSFSTLVILKIIQVTFGRIMTSLGGVASETARMSDCMSCSMTHIQRLVTFYVLTNLLIGV